MISRSVPAEFVDALLEALGDCSDALGSNNLCAIIDLYSAAPSACNEEDAAVEIPALLINMENDSDSAFACPERDFSPSADGDSPDGGTLPDGNAGTETATSLMVELLLPTASCTISLRPGHMICGLAKRIHQLSINARVINAPADLASTPLLRPTFEEIRAMRTYGRRTTPMAAQCATGEPPQEPSQEGGGEGRGGQNLGARGGRSPPPAASAGGDGGGGDSSDSNSNEDDNANIMDEDFNEEEPEDPSDGQAGKTYKAGLKKERK